MTFIFLEGFAFQRLLPPQGLLGWVVWLLLAALVGWLVWRLPRPKLPWTQRDWGWLLGLVLATPIAIVLVAIRLPSGESLPIPALGSPALGALLPFLAAIPWVLALGYFGPLPGVALAALSGSLLAFWDTRSPFTPLEFALLATLLASMLAQPYRTRFFNWLRQPLAAGLALSLLYPFIYFFTAFFWASPDPVAGLDFALSRIPGVTISVAVPLLLAAGFLQLAAKRVPLVVARPEDARPAPGERSLEGRLLFTLAPIMLLAFLLLGALSWWSAGRAAEQLLGERVRASGELAAESVPFLLETGQNLILQLAADTRLADAPTETAQALLQNHLRAVPYFEHFVLFDTGANVVAGFPQTDLSAVLPSGDEIEAVSLAIQGVSFQMLSVPGTVESDSADLAFVAAVRNDNAQVRAVLLGRTTLVSNPFAQPAVQSLNSVNALGGQGYLIDGEGRIVLAPEPEAILQPYNGRRAETALAYEDSAPDGTRRFVDYIPVTGSSWAVMTQWPARLSQQLALELALPILLVLVGLAAFAYFLLRVSLRSVTAPLQSLIGDTRRIAAGDLTAPLSVQGADEVGRLGAAFETMRQTLRVRVEEIQRLLSVSQGITATLDASAHIDPILEAALAGGAQSARLVFDGGDGQGHVGFGHGPASQAYQDLDEQILELSRKQSRVLLANPARARLKAPKGGALPPALAAFALQNGGEHLGTLWLAYDSPQTFAPDSVHYLETLADQAAKAAVNARLYTTASSGRQRLEAVFEADPDPLVVVEHGDRVVFANAAAGKAFGIVASELAGTPLGKRLKLPQLEMSLNVANQTRAELEVHVGSSEYSVAISPLEEKGVVVGHVLRFVDLSRAKQAEQARASFLATVSHDLNDPLKLTKGYVNMLGMVGDLNEQQASYVEKIDHNLENISRLTASLLDLERVSGLKGLQLQSVLLSELIQEVCDELGAHARQKKLGFSTRVVGTPRPVQADRTLLQRALFNLVDNAVKFSPRDAEVELRSTYGKATVTLAVSDRGAGIAPVDLPGLFSGEQPKAGRASGLAIVKSVVERHGGRVWVESELGTGSSFMIELPLP